MLVTAEPAAVIPRADDPFAAPQWTLKDAQYRRLGNQAQGRANQPAAYLREVHRQELGMKANSSQGRTSP
jgi:hypothetical protein